MSTRLTLTGDTYTHRDYLKKNAWKWDGRIWSKAVSADQVAAIRSTETQESTLRALAARVKGCRTFVSTASYVICVYTSPSARAENVGVSSSVRGDIYAHDAAGNYAAGARISGSAPEDRV